MSNFYDLKIYSQLSSASYGGQETISSKYIKIDEKGNTIKQTSTVVFEDGSFSNEINSLSQIEAKG